MKLKGTNLAIVENVKKFGKATDLEANIMAYFGYADPGTKEFWVGDTPVGRIEDVVMDVREIITNNVGINARKKK